MPDDKTDDLGYLSRTTKELERTLLEMEGQLDPILTTLELGDDPRVEWGTGVARRARQASECKQRAWGKIADLVQRLSGMMEALEADQSQTARRNLRRTGTEGGGPKYVNVVIRGTLAED